MGTYIVYTDLMKINVFGAVLNLKILNVKVVVTKQMIKKQERRNVTYSLFIIFY